MTGKGLEPYQGNPNFNAQELSIWGSAPEIPPEVLDPTYIPDDEEARTIHGPSHGFDPPMPDLSDIAVMLESGRAIIISTGQASGQTTERRRRRFANLSRTKKIIGCAAVAAIAVGGGAAFKYVKSGTDLCVTSEINFPDTVDISSVELCIPSDGVYMDSASGRITAQVDTHYSMSGGIFGFGGTDAPNTIGDLAIILQSPQQPSEEIARQPAAYATRMLESGLARSEGGAPLCQADINSVIEMLRDKADHFADNQLVTEGTQPLSAEQIRLATHIRLVSRFDVAGDGNDKGQEIVCS